MAGTSADGIDAACVRIDGSGKSMRVRFLWHRHRSFSASLRRQLLSAMAPAEIRTEQVARLHADLGDAFAQAAWEAIRAAGVRERPSLIGLAGQTVCHLPAVGRSAGACRGRTVTLQLGEPARVAARTGLPTVAEFRQSDVAVGGQGAPLVPWTDWVLFRRDSVSRAIQNIGGIGNVTWLSAGGAADEVIAFDTGPGNMIIDALVAHATGGRRRMDRDGRRAARGRVLHDVLAAWLQHEFFEMEPPKSTGREVFGQAFVAAQLKRLGAASSCPGDWIATATAFTARSIARACRRFLPGIGSGSAAVRPGQRRKYCRGKTRLRAPTELIVCGGGAHNPVLMAMLSAELPGVVVRPVAALGIPARAKEAVSFAMLAAARVDGVPANLPRATGAARPAVLGQIVHP